MSWTYKRKRVNGEYLYRIYTTVSEAWMTDWLTRDECLQVMFEDRLRSFRLSTIKMYMDFPDQRRIKGTRNILRDDERRDAWIKWRQELSDVLSVDYETATDADYDAVSDKYNDMIDKKYEELAGEI